MYLLLSDTVSIKAISDYSLPVLTLGRRQQNRRFIDKDLFVHLHDEKIDITPEDLLIPMMESCQII